ncbi:hypothetical protein [Aerococcus sp. UMB8623]
MGLLFEQKGGFNTKKKKNEPNRLYLLNLEVSKNTIDTFIKSEKRLQTLPYQQSVESTPRREEIDMSKTLINQGSVKITPREKSSNIKRSVESTPRRYKMSHAKTLINQGSVKITPREKSSNIKRSVESTLYKDHKEYKDFDHKDYKDHACENLNTALKEKITVDQQKEISKILPGGFLNLNFSETFGIETEKLIQALLPDENNVNEFHALVYSAFKSANKKNSNTSILYDQDLFSEWQKDLSVKVHELLQIIRTNEKINNPASYIFISLKTFFEEKSQEYSTQEKI